MLKFIHGLHKNPETPRQRISTLINEAEIAIETRTGYVINLDTEKIWRCVLLFYPRSIQCLDSLTLLEYSGASLLSIAVRTLIILSTTWISPFALGQ